MRPKPAMIIRKPLTACVVSNDAETITYVSGALEPEIRVAANPSSLEDCDTLIIIDSLEVGPEACRLKPLLLCGRSVLLLPRLGIRGLAVAAPHDTWSYLESKGLTPLPLEVHQEHLIVTCAGREYLHLALRVYKRLVECTLFSRCTEPQWIDVIKCSG